MGKACVINVDLADVFAERGRKKLLRTLAWGDNVTVVDVKNDVVEVEFVEFEEKPDGSILPNKSTGFIEPKKSAGLKGPDLIRPKAQNEVLKVSSSTFSKVTGRSSSRPTAK